MVVGACGARAIETDGPLLGVFPGVEFEETSFTLALGETLVLYSDGFETAFPDAPEASDGGAFSRRLPTTRYLDHFARIDEARREAGSLTEAFAQLAMAVDAQSGSLHQVDDITALAIAPAAAAARRERAAASVA
jgi:serine phosphatase RsbU (regulator of sigma subunit)